MTSQGSNLCDQSLVDLQNTLDRLRSDKSLALADHIVMESSADPAHPAWAIPAEAVIETMVCPALTRLGIMPACFKGIAATRARLVTVIDAVHLLAGAAPAPDGRGWLTLVDPDLSGGHALGLWWPSFCGISPVGSMPLLDQPPMSPAPHPSFIHDWRAQDQHGSNRAMARVNVHAIVAGIMAGSWWEAPNA